MPKPKNSEKAKKLQGTYQEHREVKDVPVFSVLKNAVKHPEYFGDRAIQEWDKIIKEYKASEMFSVLDIPSLQIYCKAVEDLDNIENDIHNGHEELIMLTDKGFQQISPISTLKTKCLDAIVKYGDRLLLNPKSRTGIDLGKKKQNSDPFAEKFG